VIELVAIMPSGAEASRLRDLNRLDLISTGSITG